MIMPFENYKQHSTCKLKSNVSTLNHMS